MRRTSAHGRARGGCSGHRMQGDTTQLARSRRNRLVVWRNRRNARKETQRRATVCLETRRQMTYESINVGHTGLGNLFPSARQQSEKDPRCPDVSPESTLCHPAVRATVVAVGCQQRRQFSRRSRCTPFWNRYPQRTQCPGPGMKSSPSNMTRGRGHGSFRAGANIDMQEPS